MTRSGAVGTDDRWSIGRFAVIHENRAWQPSTNYRQGITIGMQSEALISKTPSGHYGRNQRSTLFAEVDCSEWTKADRGQLGAIFQAQTEQEAVLFVAHPEIVPNITGTADWASVNDRYRINKGVIYGYLDGSQMAMSLGNVSNREGNTSFRIVEAVE